MSRFCAKEGETEVTVQTRTRGLAAPLAYDVSVASKGASAEMWFEKQRPEAFSATLRVPTNSFVAHSAKKTSNGEPATLTEGDSTTIREKTAAHLKAAFGAELTVNVASYEQTQPGKYLLRGTLKGVPLTCSVAASLGDGGIEASGTCRLSLSELSVGPVRGPMRVLTVRDDVEVLFKTRLTPAE